MANQRKDPAFKLIKDDILKKLGARIKYFREQKGYTNYEKFANAKDLNRAQYGRYEKGEDLQFTSLIKVLKALDVTLEEFFSQGFD